MKGGKTTLSVRVLKFLTRDIQTIGENTKPTSLNDIDGKLKEYMKTEIYYIKTSCFGIWEERIVTRK